jgi:hypothetical protein
LNPNLTIDLCCRNKWKTRIMQIEPIHAVRFRSFHLYLLPIQHHCFYAMVLTSVSKSLCTWRISTSLQTTSAASSHEGSTYSINHGEGSRNFATQNYQIAFLLFWDKRNRITTTIKVQQLQRIHHLFFLYLIDFWV